MSVYYKVSLLSVDLYEDEERRTIPKKILKETLYILGDRTGQSTE